MSWATFPLTTLTESSYTSVTLQCYQRSLGVISPYLGCLLRCFLWRSRHLSSGRKVYWTRTTRYVHILFSPSFKTPQIPLHWYAAHSSTNTCSRNYGCALVRSCYPRSWRLASLRETRSYRRPFGKRCSLHVRATLNFRTSPSCGP